MMMGIGTPRKRRSSERTVASECVEVYAQASRWRPTYVAARLATNAPICSEMNSHKRHPDEKAMHSDAKLDIVCLSRNPPGSRPARKIADRHKPTPSIYRISDSAAAAMTPATMAPHDTALAWPDGISVYACTGVRNTSSSFAIEA